MSMESKNNSVQVGEPSKFDLAVPLEIFSSALEKIFSSAQIETDSVILWQFVKIAQNSSFHCIMGCLVPFTFNVRIRLFKSV